MKKLDFDEYLVGALSNHLHYDDFFVSYVYRHHSKPSIIITPIIDDPEDVALCDLRQLCSSSKNLGHKYIISLECITRKFVYITNDGQIKQVSKKCYELTMPNHPDFKKIVFDLEHLELDNLYSHILKK